MQISMSIALQHHWQACFEQSSSSLPWTYYSRNTTAMISAPVFERGDERSKPSFNSWPYSTA